MRTLREIRDESRAFRLWLRGQGSFERYFPTLCAVAGTGMLLFALLSYAVFGPYFLMLFTLLMGMGTGLYVFALVHEAQQMRDFRIWRRGA